MKKKQYKINKTIRKTKEKTKMKSICKPKIKTNKKGGIVKKDDTLTYWQAVYKMICVPGATLTTISYNSLYGYVFKLNIPPISENAEFFDLNDSGTIFNVPVFSLILKFSIIENPNAGGTTLPELIIEGETPHKKSYEKLENFRNEAAIQQTIYLTTIEQCAKAICPSIVDFSFFNKDTGSFLIKQLLELQDNDEFVKIVLDYLFENIQANNAYLGLITMKCVDDEYIQLSKIRKEVLKLHQLNLQDKTELINVSKIYIRNCNDALTQIIILFIKLKIINFDCHLGNILASTKPYDRNLNSRTTLIDFGRVVDFTTEHPFSFIGSYIDINYIVDPVRQIVRQERIGIYQYIKQQYSKYYKEFFGVDGGEDKLKHDSEKLFRLEITALYPQGTRSKSKGVNNMIVLIDEIIKLISVFDLIINNIKYRTKKPQMIELLRYIYGGRLSDDWIANPPTPDNFIITPQVQTKYEFLIECIVHSTQTDHRLMFSEGRIDRMILENKLLYIRGGEDMRSFYRDDVFEWVRTEQMDQGEIEQGEIDEHLLSAAAAAAEKMTTDEETMKHSSGGRKTRKNVKKNNRK
uniref:Uncharacterized protein n=1 Tax=viral metagenome TaxID=1070528 RepID=A0A6C0D9Q8_9ZZZZ